jgi:hypothetical protein
MLHIITPLYRFENLEKVYNSIFLNDTIVWHISKSSQRESISYDFLKNDKRIRIYNSNCLDSDTTIKRNDILSNINDGYFCFLDDDTLFHENMYIKFLQCLENNFVGMLVGQQIYSNGELRLIASKPVYTHIDTGNVISHHSCLSECRWPDSHINGVNQKDFLFWNSVYNFYSRKCAIWNQPISYYNKLSENQIWKKEKKILQITKMK